MLGRVVAFTLRGCSAFSVKYGMNPLTVIHDFNTGKEKNKKKQINYTETLSSQFALFKSCACYIDLEHYQVRQSLVSK